MTRRQSLPSDRTLRLWKRTRSLSNRLEKQTPELSCPACESREARHEADDRWQCENCGWRFTVDDDGTVRDLFDLARAGRRR